MKLTAHTDIGRVYEDNQDYYVAGRLTDDTCWMILCDGMGGMSEGAKASRMAAEYLQEQIERRLLDLITPESIKIFMLEAVRRCNEMVYNHSRSLGGSAAMGTTVVMAIVRGSLAQIVHAGDSRAYHIKKREIRQITRDHSIVQELLDSGKITPEQAENHPNKNIITSALGIDSEMRVDYNEAKLAKGDMLLICSDGLSNMVSDEELYHTAHETDFYKSVQVMVEKAIAAGGYDNITVVLLGA